MSIYTALLDAARRIAPVIRDHCEQAERERRLSKPVMDAMAEAGLWRMVTPKSLGGLEVDPLTCARVIEEVAKADSVAGWALTNPLIYAFSCARLSAAGVETVIGRNPNSVIVGFTPTPIQATPVAGGYRVTGRLPFVSHCHNATWFTANARLGEAAQLPRGS